MNKDNLPELSMLQIVPESGCIQKIVFNYTLYAIIVRRTLAFEGYNFVTAVEDSLQLGVNHYAEGTLIKRHYHLPMQRKISDTLEILHIDQGKCIIDFYCPDEKPVYSTELVTGDTVILMNGGHGLHVIEKTRIIEVRQGPYMGIEKEKRLF
ncbi:MAG: hypothetical protein ABSG75_14690 [Syntrophales bacterium]|jgi:hypothetical protein